MAPLGRSWQPVTGRQLSLSLSSLEPHFLRGPLTGDAAPALCDEPTRQQTPNSSVDSEKALAEEAKFEKGEGVIVKLEQQQRARAHWDAQLDAIKGLQAASRAARQASTPKRSPLGLEHTMPARLHATAARLEGRVSLANQQVMVSPDWGNATSDSEDSLRRLSKSPLVDYESPGLKRGLEGGVKRQL
ncbi:hypothetical protein KFL_001360110 [Klebsormidium nitens]|uniref:Uncharacterized protein n=1 Tax=Klebsormidium nitens TaxID=105231 RepID=A0A1Y1HWT4_KLENI|nr:hypothetical protein KFL_001360110 [Klebsormidium nitens]|eukprot:GAQ83114.1 hypothetical protein KFL_001360110 [Klebsormidium nitens]